MLRIRQPDGTLHTIPSSGFVEGCDEDGKIGRLWFCTSGGVIHEIHPDSDSATDYKKLFSVEWIDDA